MRLDVNGIRTELEGDPTRSLLWVLRDELGLRGTKPACGEGVCGACTVLVDGLPVRSCATAVGDAAGRPITTIEGLAPEGSLHPVQRAFLAERAYQCGYCTPGIELAAAALLRRTAGATDEQVRVALDGHVCRCGVHARALRAVQRAAEGDPGPGAGEPDGIAAVVDEPLLVPDAPWDLRATDELAHDLGIDPLGFRLANMGDERLAAALRAAAERVRWPEGRAAHGSGLGIAASLEKDARIATAAEVVVTPSGDVEVARVVTAFDCGAIVDSDNLTSQIEGATMMALGPALFEAIELDDGGIANPTFATYRVPRFADVPVIEVVLLDRPDVASAGGGEVPLIPVAPAIANAIFAASGRRLRSMPLLPDRPWKRSKRLPREEEPLRCCPAEGTARGRNASATRQGHLSRRLHRLP